MLWTIVVLLLILWLLGFTMHVAGGLIHLLLVIALVVIVLPAAERTPRLTATRSLNCRHRTPAGGTSSGRTAAGGPARAVRSYLS